MTASDGRSFIDAAAGAAFRAALSLWASGVAIVTTLDASGRPWGFTASAFSSVSLDPPLILVCLSAEADCHAAFVGAGTFAVNVLRNHHRPLALRFATKAPDKFDGAPFLEGECGSPVLPDALAVLECARQDAIAAGDHTILIGSVLGASSDAARSAPEAAMVHIARRFRTIEHESLRELDIGPDLPWFPDAGAGTRPARWPRCC